MKLLRLILVASSALTTLSIVRADDTEAREATAAAVDRSYQWVSHYYENPRPDDLLSSVYTLSRAGYFDAAGQPATAIGFFSVVFAQNPQRVNSWLARANELPAAHRRILAAAAWMAGNATGARQLRELSANSEDNLRSEIAALLQAGPVSAVQSPVLSTASMDLQWGAFLASGDERNIVNVLAALGSGEHNLATSARYTLAQNAAAHPRVLDIVRTQVDRQPEAIRAELRAALNEAAATSAKPRA